MTLRGWAAGAAAITLAFPAHATWTIVAVDPTTGEVGSAGASCTPFVAGVAQLVPGHGAILAQAASNMAAKARGAERIADGGSAQAVVAEISAPGFDRDFAEQQYGVVTLVAGKAQAAAFTGPAVPTALGHRLGDGVAVQGNILTGQRVLDDALLAYRAAAARRAPLAERLLLALEAGSRAGGDARCGAKTAQSAYLGVANPDDASDRLSLRIVVTTDRDDPRNPVTLVRARYAGGPITRD